MIFALRMKLWRRETDNVSYVESFERRLRFGRKAGGGWVRGGKGREGRMKALIRKDLRKRKKRETPLSLDAIC